MVMFDRSSKGDKSLDRRWVEFGKMAKRTTSSLDEWSERDIERYDLDDPERKPTGAKNPRTWRYEKPLEQVQEGEHGALVDPRDNPRIRDGEEDGAFE